MNDDTDVSTGFRTWSFWYTSKVQGGTTKQTKILLPRVRCVLLGILSSLRIVRVFVPRGNDMAFLVDLRW